MGDGVTGKQAGVSLARRRLLAIAGFPLVLAAAVPALDAFFPSRTVRNAKPCKIRAMAASEFEAAALVHLREQKFDEAIAVLESAVERELVAANGSPSLRLLDLLATLYARKGRLEKLAALSAKVEAAAQGGCATAMLDRAVKWRSEQSKWRRDRASAEATIKWRRTTHEAAAGGRKYARLDDIVIPA